MSKPSPTSQFETRSNRDAFEVKLKRFLGTQDAAHRRRANRTRLVALGFLLATAFSGYMTYMNRRDDDEAVLLGILTVVLAIVALVFFFKSTARHDELERARDVAELYEAVSDDLHPRTLVLSRFDLSEATAGAPERSGTSPYSGAQKRWFRHAWLDLRWAFADGNLMRLELVDLVKTKSGTEIRREHQVKGRLKVNGGVYRKVAPASLRHLRTATRAVEGGHMVYFWGTVADHDDLLAELKLLYGALEPHGARQVSG